MGSSAPSLGLRFVVGMGLVSELSAAAPHPSEAVGVMQHLSQPNFIGGCRAHAWRASYTLFDGDASGACDSQTPSLLCGEPNSPAEFQSGMQLPRHNVPQYMGNGVWDALARDGFGRLVKAMMGDPFAFTIAPEVDALRRLLMTPSTAPHVLEEELQRAWSIDERYEGTQSSVGTRANFMNAVSGRHSTSGGLSREFVLNSSAWARLGPPAVKDRIRLALEGREPFSPESATCAAIHMMDVMFSQRGRVSVFNDLPSSADDMLPQDKSNPTLFEELYDHTPSDLPDNVREDPHNVIYTSPYQHNANGWYGGNMSVKFSPTMGGSGIDTKWAIYRGCPMPGQEREFCSNRQLWTNAHGTHGMRKPACDLNAINCADGFSSTVSVDQGEMRTPHYKAPDEVQGLSWFNWNREHHCVFHVPGRLCPQYYRNRTDGTARDGTAPKGMFALKFDMTALIRPTLWSLHRAPNSGAANWREPELVNAIYIAFPNALSKPVYGVDFNERQHKFFAAPSPPLAIGVEELIARENFIAPDILKPSDNPVPIWGVLYPCAATNLPQAYTDSTVSEGNIAAIRCSAMRRLRETWHQFAFDPVYSYLYTARLPNQWEHEFASLRIWSSNSAIDLTADAGAGRTRPTNGHQQQACVLSFAAAVRLDASGKCERSVVYG